MFFRQRSVRFEKDTSGAESAMFDDDRLVSYGGVVPVMTLVEQTGLPQLLLAEKITITTSRIKSGAANPAPKLATTKRHEALSVTGADSVSSSTARVACCLRWTCLGSSR